MLGVATQAVAALESQIRTAPPATTTPPAPTGVSRPTHDAGFDDEAIITGRDLKAFAQTTVASTIQPDIQQLFDANAQIALDRVRSEQPEMFARYGPEILSHIGRLPDKRYHTLDNLRQIVQFTKAGHLDEIAREMAGRLAGEMVPQIRSGGGGAHGAPTGQPATEYTLESEKLPSDWKVRAAKAGVTEQTIDEFCRTNDMTRQQFFDTFGANVISEIVRHG